jgi:hypothetical protein
MKIVPLFSIGAALAASPTIAQPPGAAPAVPADCPLVIGFSSYAMGIDGATLRAVDALLSKDRGVRLVTRHPWGREGEVTLCVRTRSRADAARLFETIRRRLPARPRGPVSVRTRDGRNAQAPRRR